MVRTALILAVAMIPAAFAQQPTTVPPAPVPAQIMSAKKVFVSNAGGASDLYAEKYSGGPDRSYNEFYAAVKNWGRFELVTAPANADVILQITFSAPVGPTSIGPRDDPQFLLVVLDPKTHVSLWTIIEHVGVANREATAHKNFDETITRLVDDLKKLTSTQ